MSTSSGVTSPGASSLLTSPSVATTPLSGGSLLSTTPSGSGVNSSRILLPVKRICLVGADLRASKVEEDAGRFAVPVVYSEDAKEFLSGDELSDVAFVVSDFSGPVFEALSAAEATVLGPTALAQLAMSEESPTLFMATRPLFCTSMRGLGICFNGYRSKENKKDLRRFLFMIHSMGGRVLADVTLQKPKVTHLVSSNCKGEKYTYASTFEIPVMQDGWITEAWGRRLEAGFSAEQESFLGQWRVKPFHGACVYFLGFQEEERCHMISELKRNGGQESPTLHDPGCTHVVVDNVKVTSMPRDLRRDVHVVKEEWFWASIQMDVCAEEEMHLFSDYIDSFLSPCSSATSAAFLLSSSTPGSHSRRKKRRTEAMQQLAQSDVTSLLQHPKKSRLSLGDLTNTTGSLILSDATTPDKRKAELLAGTQPDNLSSLVSPSQQQQVRSARQQVFLELVQTEENYVRILRTIVEVFKEPLEDPKSQLLNQTEMRIIFGNLPPILQVHSKMLADLVSCLKDWKEHNSVGSIVSKYSDELMRAYPPFVNFFEDTRRMLEECDRTNPRFHAFLKVCQSRGECGRQTLAELLIRPVQRLGSITLLLNDLLKHTSKVRDHPDEPALREALSRVKEVLTNINEDKRKTEGQVHIFEIFSDIENCPAHLISARRIFLCKVDVVELGGSDELCGKGTDLSLFLFSDVLEVSKRRGRNTGSLTSRSPSTMSLRNAGLVGSMGNGGGAPLGTGIRTHKHVELINLNAIRRVVDLIDNQECQDCFTLVCRTNEELKEHMFVFRCVSEDVNKGDFLKLLCRHVANTMYRQDPDTYLVQMRPDDLGLSNADLSVNKAYRSLSRGVKKAFSFSRTPTTSRLTRAVSSMISPLTSHNAATYRDRISSTPSGDLQNLRLQSCSNLLEGSSPRRMTMTPGRRLPMGPPCAPSPSSSTHRGSQSSSESPQSEKSGGFTIPKTPTLLSVKRRASFKFLTNSLGKKY